MATDHGGCPYVPFRSLALCKVTLAKEEKYVALLLSYPPKKLNIFISLGNSETTNLTSINSPFLLIWYVVDSIFRTSTNNFCKKRLTGIQFSLQLAPKIESSHYYLAHPARYLICLPTKHKQNHPYQMEPHHLLKLHEKH